MSIILGYDWDVVGILLGCIMLSLVSVAPNTPRLYDRSPMTPRHFLASGKCSPELPRLKSQRPIESRCVCFFFYCNIHLLAESNSTLQRRVGNAGVLIKETGPFLESRELSGFSSIGKTPPKSKQVC